MSYVIAIAGKGGVGKSTISSLLVRALHERSGEVILAVDADPNFNLGQKLGVDVGTTIGDLREKMLKNADEIPTSMSKQEYVRYHIGLALWEGDSFDLLTMGRSEGPGCYCYINNILRTFMDELMEDYSLVVIDNEAGMEHLSRRTTRRMDALVLVSDATKIGIETATRLKDLASNMDIEIGRKILIINRVPKEIPSALKEAIGSAGFNDVIYIPIDKQVEELTIVGEPLISLDGTSKALRSVRELALLLR
ncbi:MAG TPA: AAA family ATPase [Methanomassiliicoccales archaeon]|nr:AAA family ATPase [Methanomassiliicoccales archaeon]